MEQRILLHGTSTTISCSSSNYQLPQKQGVVEPTIPTTLRLKINEDFGSLSSLRNLIFQTAMSINGSGWVWLIVGPNSQLKVLATYNAGSAFDLPQRQIVDPNTKYNLDSSGRFGSVGRGQLDGLRVNRKHEYLILPILGLNCWEHAYVPDYGVSMEGKQQYLKNWWASINWKRVFDAQARRNLQRRASIPE